MWTANGEGGWENLVSDIKLFRLEDDNVHLVLGSSMAIERSLQTLIERHLEAFLGVRFLATEYSTTKSHGGRIDTLGIDETDSPVIIEYKRALNENVINQGLFYLNWLMDHQADFTLLVMKKLGAEFANAIEWRYPRLVCIAGDFTKYDVHAIEQIPRNIDLIRYRRYGDDLILLEQIARNSSVPSSGPSKPTTSNAHPKGLSTGATSEPAVLEQIRRSSVELQDWFHILQAFILGLGEDIEERTLPGYIAFRRLKTFAYFNFSPTKNRIAIDMPIPPNTVPIEKDFTEQKPGNYLRVLVDSAEDVVKAQPIITMSYERS